MGPAVKWGVILAVGVVAVSAAMIGSGLHRNAMVYGLVAITVFIVLNIVAVIMALRQTAGEKGYLGQLGSGIVLGLVGGALIFVLSYLTTSVLFPEAIPEMVEAQLELMAQSGMPQEELEAQAERLRGTTSAEGALQGTIGTIVTSTIVAAIAAIFLRRK